MGLGVSLGSTGKLNGVSVRGMKRPGNGKAWITILAGGYKDTRHNVAGQLLKLYGMDCRYFVDDKKGADTSIHPKAELVVVLSDCLDKFLIVQLIKSAKQAGIPCIEIRKKVTSWEGPMALAGFKSPPPWRDAQMFFDADEPPPEKEEPALPPTPVANPLEGARPLIVPKPPSAAGGLLPVAAAPAKPAAPAAPYDQARETFLKAIKVIMLTTTRSKLAEDMELTDSAIALWESGRSIPMYGQYLRLRELFPDFPELKGLRGERAAQMAKKTAPPAPAANMRPLSLPITPVKEEPPVTPAPAPVTWSMVAEASAAPVERLEPVAQQVSPVSPVSSVVNVPSVVGSMGGALHDYALAIAELQAADDALGVAQLRRDNALAKVDEIHAKLIRRK